MLKSSLEQLPSIERSTVEAELVESSVNLKKQLQQSRLRQAEAGSRTLSTDCSYPCPICKHGTIEPITLTEAWGCDRCQQIFERSAEPNTIGKLSTPYHRPRTWQWTGRGWVLSKKSAQPKTLKLVTAIVSCLLLWAIVSRIELSMTLGVILLGVVATFSLFVVIFWVSQRR